MREGWPGTGHKGDNYAEESEVGAELRGDTGVLVFWALHRMCVFEIFVVDTNEESYEGKHAHRILYQNERRKKGKYIEACLERLLHFIPLVLLVHGMMG